MRRSALLLVLLASGCAPAPPLSVDPRITVLPQSGVIVAYPPLVTVDAHGITDVSIELRNPSPHDVAVNCVVDWFGSNSQPVGGLSAQPSRISVGAYAAEFCRTVSPNPGARVFRAAINPAF